jgi:anti-sigma B factor antagonist
MEFSYKISEKENYCLIQLKGNLIEKGQAVNLIDDVHNLVLKDANRFVLNLNDFKYMNSTGLTVLLNILTLARKAGGEAVICCVGEKVNTLLTITKLNNIFTVADSEEHAVKNLN